MTRAALPPAYDARMDVVERIARALRVPRPVDLAIAGALAAWTLVEAVAVNGPGSTPTRIGFALLVSVPLLWRRTLPLPVLAFICAMLLLRALTADVPEYGTAPFPSMLVATYSVGAYTASAAFAVPAVLLPVATMIAATRSDFWNTDPQPGDVAILTFFVVAAWSAGRIVRHRSAQAAAARAETAARARRRSPRSAPGWRASCTTSWPTRSRSSPSRPGPPSRSWRATPRGPGSTSGPCGARRGRR